MPIATNDKGEAVFLDNDGAWKPATMAEHPETKERLAYDGSSWTPLPPQTSTAEAIGRGITTGASFGLRDEGQGLIEAGGGSKEASPLDIGYLARGAYRKLTGDPEAEKRYQAAVERERGTTKQIEREHPGAYIGGQIGGALAVPIGAAARGATWGARALAGAKTGAATGALTGFGEGEGLEGSVKGAAIGAPVGFGVGGVAAPLTEGLVRGAGAVVSGPVSMARGLLTPRAASERAVGRALVEAERSDPAGLNRITQGQFQQAPGEAVVGDVLGEPGRNLARSAANISPEAREVMNQTLDARGRGQGDRLTSWLDNQFSFPNQHVQQQALEATARTTNNAAYQAAERAGQGGLWSPELERLASSQAVADAMRGAIRTSQDEAVRRGMGGFNPKISFTPDGRIQFNRGPGGVPTYPDLRYWDQVRRELSDAAQKAAPRTEERMRLNGLASALNAELDNLVPAYQTARSGAAGFFGAENALEAGANFVTQRFANDEARAALGAMNPTQRALFRDGFVARLKETIAETPDRADLAKRLATSPAARERNQIAMGPQRANEFEAMLRTETIMQKLKEAVQGNSTTVRQLITAGASGAAGGGYLGFDPTTSGISTSLILTGLKKGGDARMARHITELLMERDPAVLQAGIRAIAANQRNMQLLQNVENAVSRATSQQAPRRGGAREGAPQRSMAEYTYAPGEIEDNQAASFNGPQGYPNFNWVNPAGVDAFLASGPMSKNIEDRRGEHSPADAARYRRQMRIEGRADGGPVEEGEPYVVGERGPELFVPRQDGDIDPFARAAARTGHRGRQEGAGTRFVEGGYGIPAAIGSLNEQARRAIESAGQLQRTGDQYDPAPVVQQALGAVGAPMVGPAIEGTVLGAGMVRRAAIPQVAKAELKAAEAAPDDLWHGVSKVKLPRPVSEMTSAHEATAPLAERSIDPAALQGGWLLPAWGDRSATNSLLSMVGDQKLARPVEMQGGHGFMAANQDTGAAWASGKPVVGRLAKQARELGAEGDPVYFPYTAMGERSIDFSHHISDTLAEMLKGRPMSKEAVNNFNIAMRKPNAAFPGIEDWPGLKSPKLREYLASAGGDARNKFAKIMDTAGYQSAGLPSVAEARVAATDPRLLNVPTGASGASIAKLDPEGRVIAAPSKAHRTYDTQLGGQYVGGLPQSVPKEVMYPDMLSAYEAMGYDPVQFAYLMQRGKRGAPIAQRADQRWVDNVSQYLEANQGR